MSTQAAASATRQDFLHTVDLGIARIVDNPYIHKLRAGSLSLADYHRLLCRLFHPVHASPATLALAAARCPDRLQGLREALLRRAQEEANHGRWILEDLRRTGYQGPAPDLALPDDTCLAYLAFEHYVATVQPAARLGIAALLEAAGARFSAAGGDEVPPLQGLDGGQRGLFPAPGAAGVSRLDATMEILDAAGLSPRDWAWMCKGASAAAGLYQRIWSEER